MKRTVSKGAVHIHTTHSDGTGSIKQTVKAAKKAGLEWIIITDHNTLAGLNEEGVYEGVVVLTGNEISPEPGNHYLAFDINKEISEKLPPQSFIDEVNKQGGFGFIAHPDEKINRKNSFKPLRWTDWEVTGFHGIEIWNYMSDWVDKYEPKKAIYQYLFRHLILTGPTQNILNRWDDLNNKNRGILPALGSADAHALKYSVLKVFPYFDTFKTITNYIYLEEKLSSDFDKAKKQIYNALKAGNNLIVNRNLSKKSDEINFYIENNGRLSFPGDTSELNEESILSVRLPEKANIKIIRNGQIIRNVITHEFEMSRLESGKYRLEIFLKNKPWAFSNPIIAK